MNHTLEAVNEKATNGYSEPASAYEPKSTTLQVKQVTNIENIKPCNDENESKEKIARQVMKQNIPIHFSYKFLIFVLNW